MPTIRRVEQLLGQRLRRRQMQVGEEDLPRPHQSDFRFERLLHLQDEVGLVPDLGGCPGSRGARPLVGSVRDGAAPAGAGLHHDVVPMGPERRHPGGRDRHPVLVRLDLGGHPYSHDVCSSDHPASVRRQALLFWPRDGRSATRSRSTSCSASEIGTITSRRGIPSRYVARRSTTGGMLPPRALRAGASTPSVPGRIR